MARKGNPIKYAVAGALRAARRVTVDLLDGLLEDLLIVVFSLSNILTGLIESMWGIIYLTVLGLLLCLWRYNFILSVNALAANFTGIAATINLAIMYLNWTVGKTIFVGALVVDAVEGIVAAVEQKPFDEYIDDAVCPICYFTAIPLINVTSVEAWLNEVPPTCARLNSAGKIYDALVRYNVSPAVCPSLRFIWPVRWLFELAWPLSNAFSLSYNPIPPYVDGVRDDVIGQGNCEPTQTEAPHWECILLGLGFFCLEWLLPLLLFGVFWQAMGFAVLRLLGRTFYAVLRLFGAAVGVVVGTFVRLVPG